MNLLDMTVDFIREFLQLPPRLARATIFRPYPIATLATADDAFGTILTDCAERLLHRHTPFAMQQVLCHLDEAINIFDLALERRLAVNELLV